MLLIAHIIIALTSLVVTGATYFAPSKTKLFVSYFFVAGTFVSGTALIVSKPTHLMQSCIEGLLYLGLVATGLILARYKLAKMV